MERSDQLFSGGYRFFFDDALFHPGTDTFLLSSFPALKAGKTVCDLGCRTGLLGLLLLQRQPRLYVTGVELLPDAVRLAEKTAAENGLTAHLNTLQGDLRDIRRLLPAGSFDLVVCNPPYYPVSTGRLPVNPALQNARAEVSCTLEDICEAAAYLLRWSGSLCLVHKPERLTDLLCTLRTHAIEPKRMRMVCKTAGAAPSLLLLEGRRGGRPGLMIEPPLILREAGGSPTAELNTIYFRQQEDAP